MFCYFAGMEFDVAMPTVLFLITLAATFLSRKVEGKLKDTFEEREFRIRDAVLLIASIGVMVTVIVFIPQMALMALFLFSYSMLLFMFTYIFSDFSKTATGFFCCLIITAGFLAGVFAQTAHVPDMLGNYGPAIFFGMATAGILALFYEQRRASKKERWYLAILPPALFISLYAFFSGTPIWFPYLLDLYGAIFAVLIILYIGSLFTWKTTLFFAAGLTVVDIFLVLVTGSMVSAAKSVAGLRLPVLIGVPIVPLIANEGALYYMSLGLGDFFFAGLLAIQTWKKFGRKPAILSLVAMSVSFFVFEAFLLTYGPTAFPGTVMIICGWLPILLWKTLTSRKTAQTENEKSGKIEENSGLTE